MRLSLNELEVRYARAFEGMGAPAGLAQDAARIVVKHDLWGLRGLESLCERLARLDGRPPPQPRVRVEGVATVIEADGGSLLYAGPQALDLLEARVQEAAGAEVRVVDCADSEFAAGLAALAAQRGLTATVRAVVDDHALAAAACGREVALYREALETAPPSGTVELRAGARLGDHQAETAAIRQTHGADRLQALESKAVAHGVPVDAELWQRIYVLGARFLVSESETSRRRGAGSGSDTD